MDEEHLRKLIARHKLEHIGEALLAAAAMAVRVIKDPFRRDFPGISRLGGIPDVPPGFVWPTRDGRSLDFLAQINCAELSDDNPGHAFPDSGFLYFFYDIEQEPWGYDPADREGSTVIYSPAGPLEAASLPSDRYVEELFPLILVRFRRFLSIPRIGSAAYDSLGIGEGDQDAYGKLYDAVRKKAFGSAEGHQLFGHPQNIQGDMQLQCQAVTHGLHGGDEASHNDSKAREFESQTEDWLLLLQLDSDDDLEITWCDAGKVYFWIREVDLRQGDFSNTWAILQCY